MEVFILVKNKSKLLIYLKNIFEITKKEFANLQNNFSYLLCFFFLGLIFFPILSLIKDPVNGFHQIFSLGDVLAYYAKWAREWYNGQIPETTFFRPHLWSVNISIIYTFFQNEYLELFSKQLFNIISVYFLLFAIGLSLILQNTNVFLFSLVGIYYSYFGTFGQGNSGYMEIPLSFGFVALITFIYEIYCRNSYDKYSAILLSIFSSFVLLTKELGWIISINLLIYFYFIDKNFLKNKFFFKILILIIIIFVPFYIYSQIKYNLINLENPVFKLLLFDENTHLSAGHGSRYLSLGTRIIDGFNKIPEFILYPIILTILTYGFGDKISKFLLTPFIIFYFLIWLFLFSNEFRYLYPIIVVCYLQIGINSKKILNIIINYKFRKIVGIFITFVFLFFCLINLIKKNDYETIIKKNEVKKIMLLKENQAEIITNFFELYEKDQIDFNILTNIYLVYEIGFSKLKKSKVEYLNFEPSKENIKNFDILIIEKNCNLFLKYDFIIKLKNIDTCVLMNKSKIENK